MNALAKALQEQGHRVSYIGTQDGARRARQSGLDYYPVGEEKFSLGSQPKFFNHILAMSPLWAIGYGVKFARTRNEMLFREVPAILKAEGIQALIVDQLEVVGGTIAEYCRIPFVTVCNALPVNAEAGVPPYFTQWGYDGSNFSQHLNAAAYQLMSTLMGSVYRDVIERRRIWGLKCLSGEDQGDSSLAVLSQMVQELDFPRSYLPKCFHYVGPLRNDEDTESSFPFEKLDGRPIFYASLGTIVNSRRGLFTKISQACEGLEVQLVLAHGGVLSDREINGLPGSPIVVSYAPQRKIIERSSLCITHGGMNTVLDALGSGVPLVVMPIFGEQPGIAARVKHVGAGVIVDPNDGDLRETIKKVLSDRGYQQRSAKLRESICNSGGVTKASKLIAEAFGCD
jgi:zeaxanthin glucosyltransferase